MQKELILKEYNDLKNAFELLDFSVKKYVPFDQKKDYTINEMEFYDSLSFRFEKLSEQFLYIFRGLELYFYSKNSETLRENLLVMEKLGIVSSTEKWMEIRLLRNKVAHAYLPAQLYEIYQKIIEYSKDFEYSFSRIKEKIIKL